MQPFTVSVSIVYDRCELHCLLLLVHYTANDVEQVFFCKTCVNVLFQNLGFHSYECMIPTTSIYEDSEFDRSIREHRLHDFLL